MVDNRSYMRITAYFLWILLWIRKIQK